MTAINGNGMLAAVVTAMTTTFKNILLNPTAR
jgi:hypothetical protein